MQENLQALPSSDLLFDFIEKLLAAKKDIVKSVVLFGSMAKMEYTRFSDYDLFIVVEREQVRFLDRLPEYYGLTSGRIEPLVYIRTEVESMFEDCNPLLLDVLRDGIVLHDDGFWKDLKTRFEHLLQTGAVTPKRNGWIIRSV